MSNTKKKLQSSSVFSSLDESDLDSLAALFEKREIKAGDTITNSGEAAQYFFLLHSGSLLLAMEEGRSVVLNTPGDFIGLELLSARGVYKTSVTVLENGRLSAIPREAFLAFIQEDSDAAADVMASWQEYLERTAPFAKNMETISFPDHF